MSKSKRCSLCKRRRPLGDFYRDPHACTVDGRRADCKHCHNERQRKRRGSKKKREGFFGATHWLAEQKNRPAWAREVESAFDDAVSRPSAYELRNMGSGHGLPIDLGDVRYGVFWSKGFKGCEFNCGHRLDDWATPMYVTVERRPDGTAVWRKSCTKHSREE